MLEKNKTKKKSSSLIGDFIQAVDELCRDVEGILSKSSKKKKQIKKRKNQNKEE